MFCKLTSGFILEMYPNYESSTFSLFIHSLCNFVSPMSNSNHTRTRTCINIPISFPAMLGIIALVGIVVNNAIVMVDTMNTYHAGGMLIREAAAKGAAERIRPILSTTLTTIVGLIPLALSDPMWMPLCSAIIFGLLVSTISGQLVIPCLYFLFTKDKPLET